MVDTLGQWQLTNKTCRLSVFASQGMASVDLPDRGQRIVYRGDWSIPHRLKKQGWVHIGDPGSFKETVFDAYQGSSTATSKLFVATTPDGKQHEFMHELEAGEQFNNSFACVSPDGQWLVSGEWNEESRLLVFPAPLTNTKATSSLELATTIEFDRPARNIQGATFIDQNTILCSTNDLETDLWPYPQQLLQITLKSPLTGDRCPATVTMIGSFQSINRIKQPFEVEGIDYDLQSGQLRIGIIPPGILGQIITNIYTFERL